MARTLKDFLLEGGIKGKEFVENEHAMLRIYKVVDITTGSAGHPMLLRKYNDKSDEIDKFDKFRTLASALDDIYLEDYKREAQKL